MALQNLDLGALEQLDDGRVAIAFKQALTRAHSDCRDRPAVGEARIISIVCRVSPLPDDKGELESVNVTFVISETTPKRKTRPYNMRSTGLGLMFNDLSPADNRQLTIDTNSKPKANSQ